MPNIYKSKKWLPLFLIPAFLFMAVYLYYPFFMNILNSFQSIRTLGLAAGEWNDPWYTNYVMLFQDAEVWTSLKNTCIMIVVTLVVQVGLALVLALMVDNVRHGTQFFRTVYFFPIVISATALGLLFNLIVLYDKGMLNLQRIFMIIVAAAGVAVGYFGSSIVSIMEDVGAPAGAALVPIFCGIFFWGKKMNEKGTLITILVAVVATLAYWAVGSPIPGVSHFVFGLVCATITMFVANSIFYNKGERPVA